MSPDIDSGDVEFSEFVDSVSGEVFHFQVDVYSFSTGTEIFCDFFDGKPSVFNQIDLSHSNIPKKVFFTTASIVKEGFTCHLK